MKRLKSITYPRWLSILAAVFVPVLSYYLLELMTHNPFEIPVQFQLLGWLFCYLVSGLVFFISGRMNLALILPLLFTALLGTVNYFVLQFRQSPILPWDIASMGTALSVADHFSFTFPPKLIGILAVYLLLALFCVKVYLPLKRHWAIRAAGFGVTAVLSFVYVLCLQNDSIMNALDVYEMPFTQDYTYEQNGFFVSFLVNTKYLKVERPDGYSPEKADSLLKAADSSDGNSVLVSSQDISRNLATGSDKELPNIIVVMNEAYSDLSVIGDFEASEDYMPYFRSLYGSENTISGNVHVSVLGGNTANTEFEFLTGDTMAFLPTGSIPYQQFISDNLPALPQVLKEYGYTTTALHPYNSNGWRREEVYPLLGFDEFLYNGTFTYKKRLRGYITDESAFKEIIRAYEEKDDEGPFFSFLVTMQNHGGYAKEWEDFERSITVKGREDDELSRINAYLTLLKVTDDAYKDLISYYENVDEKTIILMFGDHQPHMETGFLTELYGKDYNSLSQEEMALRYQTPFVLWANYDIGEAENIDISANYLGTLLMDVAGLEKTPYQNYLSELQKQLPVITANFCKDADGNFYSTSDFDQLDQLLKGYEIIQYNHLFDENHRKDENYLNPDS
ncbi:MAG: sulfatase-like hydrolase/transferase [Lachnospiraceae bacterium]|nr:sulfatase-like hydrolase/transferase [Lachnospiraceae bacterium]